MYSLSTIPSYDFLGLKVSQFRIDELLEWTEYRITNNLKTVVYGYSLGTFPYFRKYPEIGYISNSFDVLLCDGRGFFFLNKLFRYPVEDEISIPNYTNLVLELANKHKFSVMIIGSSTANNQEATKRCRMKYSDAIVFDGYDGGDFGKESWKTTIEKINSVKPDILLVGVSSPKKEVFAKNNLEVLEVKLIIPFGGAIDIMSGKSKPIPITIKKMGLGGIYRFIQEPKRLFRDSILYGLSVVFIMLPVLVVKKLILKNEFNVINFYNKL
jgi:N-acetylglucosaminyldiphosphoundecaprenol N-acetyl-beta-D-mannosaminyltransferase